MHYFRKKKNEPVNKREAFIANSKYTKQNRTLKSDDVFNGVDAFEEKPKQNGKKISHMNDTHNLETSRNSFLDGSFKEEVGITSNKGALSNQNEKFNSGSSFEEKKNLDNSSSEYGMESYNEDLAKEYSQKGDIPNSGLKHSAKNKEENNVSNSSEPSNSNVYNHTEGTNFKNPSPYNSVRDKIIPKNVDRDIQHLRNSKMDGEFKQFVGSPKNNKQNSSLLSNQGKTNDFPQSDRPVNENIPPNSSYISSKSFNKTTGTGQSGTGHMKGDHTDHFYDNTKAVSIPPQLSANNSVSVTSGDIRNMETNLNSTERNWTLQKNERAQQGMHHRSPDNYGENAEESTNGGQIIYKGQHYHNSNLLEQSDRVDSSAHDRSGNFYAGIDGNDPTGDSLNSLQHSQRYIDIGESGDRQNVQNEENVRTRNRDNFDESFLKNNNSSTKNEEFYKMLNSNMREGKEKISGEKFKESVDAELEQKTRGNRRHVHSSRSFTQPIHVQEELGGHLIESTGHQNEQFLKYNTAINSIQSQPSRLSTRKDLSKSINAKDISAENVSGRQSGQIEKVYKRDESNSRHIESRRSYMHVENVQIESRRYSISSKNSYNNRSRENFEEHKNNMILSEKRTMRMPESLIELNFNLNSSVCSISESTNEMNMENGSLKCESGQEHLMNTSEESADNRMKVASQMEYRNSVSKHSRKMESKRQHEDPSNMMIESQYGEDTDHLMDSQFEQSSNHLIESQYDIEKCNDNMSDINSSSTSLNKSQHQMSNDISDERSNFIKPGNYTHKSQYGNVNSGIVHTESRRSPINLSHSEMQLRSISPCPNNNLINQNKVYKESNGTLTESRNGLMNSQSQHNEMWKTLTETNDTFGNSKYSHSVSGSRRSHTESASSGSMNNGHHDPDNLKKYADHPKGYADHPKGYADHPNDNLEERPPEPSHSFQQNRKYINEMNHYYDNRSNRPHLNRSEYVPRKNIPHNYKKFNTCVRDDDQKADLLQAFQKGIKTKWGMNNSQIQGVNEMGKSRNALENRQTNHTIHTSENYNLKKQQSRNYFSTGDSKGNVPQFSRRSRISHAPLVHNEDDEQKPGGKMHYNDLENTFENFEKEGHKDGSDLEFSFDQENEICKNMSKDFSTSITNSQLLMSGSHNIMHHSGINSSNHFELEMSNKSNKTSDMDKFAMENNFDLNVNSNYIKRLTMNDNFVNTNLQISYMENEIQNKIKDLDNFWGENFENKCNSVLNRIEKLLSSDFFSES
ncbi:conserved Plasmodium protein, unknown function [Plasmodium knowlesi strain H]|uniref:Uncharacterized protein n=3 Tax=Plasmodium knowlesi TaxID=5850 RepID=A0A5K1V323_PLAKH|nr:conserved Plasmodium protein, unknown function [Plasmodium knowlesi strain H]OTN63728.1 Uncharacterized protein PKNOH_S140253200 [Plasmodium knowlesi]CAA9990949.1 conserved Plasmodium protein, unknown function [Plasmodium knowlesi strain H]SBO20829.1 conserved Plasmodium protein, unknown function [Plasmodium knowlesi strain H]SBO21250.1 conserved Plasmodium protein, unknown function [Plasmodium knowlesi strain H]VVS80423.1 conserved Plasmodium protein, unknown function [Plasmodium knowlesi |eukprot:XP_002262232.1 hypothetical protein, conserved in Plasmodium species [Plasmodium knowlesi strain H]